jgi:hypothetical protein
MVWLKSLNMLFHVEFSLWMIWRSRDWNMVVEKEPWAYWRIVDHLKKDPTMLGVDIDVMVVEQLEIATLRDSGYSDS